MPETGSLAAIAASKFLEMSAGHNQDLHLPVLPTTEISCHFPAEFAACYCTGFYIRTKIIM